MKAELRFFGDEEEGFGEGESEAEQEEGDSCIHHHDLQYNIRNRE